MAYRHSVTTFVDILGFADLVAGGDGSFPEVVEKLDAIGATAARPIDAADTMTTTVSFSDSVIRARPLGSGTAYDALLHEIQELAAAQWQLLEFGMLIRGGTTIGPVSVEDGRAFGPAFVRAYRLESSLAISPRIIIDPMVIQSIRADLRRATTGAGKTELISELRNHIRQGDDGLWYVDYVNSVWITTADRNYVRTALTDMKSFIIGEARKFEDKPLILPKYLWLVRYHNDSVHRLLRGSPELKITATDVPASDGFLKPRRRSPA